MTSADLIFVLRKVAGFAISPYVWLILALLLCMVLVWRGRRGLATALMGLMVSALLFVAFVPLGWGLIHQRETIHAPAPVTEPVDGIILLGGGERRAVSAHWGRAEINEAGDRVIAAATLARQFPQARVLVTGGHALRRPGRPPLRSEAVLSAEILIGLGVAKERLLIENRARNTPENARRGLIRAAPEPGARWVLVTSGFHMDRALRQFEQAGWEGLIPYPVDFRTTTWGDALGWAPYRNLAVLESGLREQLGRLVLWIGGL
jgi:uncharacterized SAM-binding protein YcdF (DUF218 family)